MSISNRNYKTGRNGITLTETVFAVGIAAIVIVAVVVTFIQTIEISKRINYEYTANNLAKSRIERARAVMEASGFSALPDLGVDIDSILDKDGIENLDGEYKRTTQIATNYGGSARLTQVIVTVSYKFRGKWRDAGATTLTTVFANIE